MTLTDIVFAPYLPWWLTITLALAIAALVVYATYRRARGTGYRLLFLGVALAALINPQIVREEREQLANIAVLVKDESASAELSERGQARDLAHGELRSHLESLGNLQIEEITVGGHGERGSMLFEALRAQRSDIDSARIAGYFAITDGLIHDVPPVAANLPGDAPLHVLLTGEPGEIDRKLVVKQAPSFGMVGEPLEFVLRVEDAPVTGASAQLTVRQDGQIVVDRVIREGEDTTVSITLEKAGQTAVEIEVGELAGELTTVNNRTALFVNGIRDRLRVLLVSGQPYPGLRVWRNLLKADPAVDLVHFTILRPPEKQDGTPIRELALIAFPSRELFEVKLPEFDLVIFDRYERRGLLPLVYLDNVARYVEQGGALLDAAGPEFAEPMSLYRTPLARVLPGRPSGEVYEQGYAPSLTDQGNRHPVTADLDQQGLSDEEAWGRWFRQVDVEAGNSQILMTGVSDRPLLLLNRVGEGRVAQLLSDHAWLWARGFEDGGPQATLLRRLVHWLMKEPELEEESLRGFAQGDTLVIERRSLEPRTDPVTVRAPSGAEFDLDLIPFRDGIDRAEISDVEDGLYRLTSGDLIAYASPRRIDALELSDLRATADRLAPIAQATSGTISWLSETGTPEIRLVEPGRSTSGRGWLGINDRDAHRTLGIDQSPLLPMWLALLVLGFSAAMAWWREGRG